MCCDKWKIDLTLLLNTKAPKELEMDISASSCKELTTAGIKQHLQASTNS